MAIRRGALLALGMAAAMMAGCGGSSPTGKTTAGSTGTTAANGSTSTTSIAGSTSTGTSTTEGSTGFCVDDHGRKHDGIDGHAHHGLDGIHGHDGDEHHGFDGHDRDHNEHDRLDGHDRDHDEHHRLDGHDRDHDEHHRLDGHDRHDDHRHDRLHGIDDDDHHHHGHDWHHRRLDGWRHRLRAGHLQPRRQCVERLRSDVHGVGLHGSERAGELRRGSSVRVQPALLELRRVRCGQQREPADEQQQLSRIGAVSTPDPGPIGSSNSYKNLGGVVSP